MALLLLPRRPAPRPTTALDGLRLLLREHVGPLLRREGLRGSGSAWTLPCDTHWALVGVAHPPDLDERTVRVCPLLTVVERATWERLRAADPRLPEVPSATVPSAAVAAGGGWQRRLPELVPGLRPSTWWTLRGPQDVADVAPLLLAPLRSHGLPALRAVLAEERRRRPACGALAGDGATGCAAPAEVALRGPRRRLFLCADHAAPRPGWQPPDWELLARWPDLLAG